MKIKQYFILLVALLGIATVNAEMMDVSCVYETTEKFNEDGEGHHHSSETKPAKWFFWRKAKEVEVLNAAKNFGEKWTLTSKQEVMYQSLYHDKKFLLDFQPADLKILGKQTNWDIKKTLLPKSLLKSLTQKQTAKFNDYKMIRYEGDVAGIQYQIDWLPELKLPSRVVKKAFNKQVITELKELFPLDKTPYKQFETEKYDDMDYADIGDNESHPVVAQLQKNTGIGYFHQH